MISLARFLEMVQAIKGMYVRSEDMTRKENLLEMRPYGENWQSRSLPSALN